MSGPPPPPPPPPASESSWRKKKDQEEAGQDEVDLKKVADMPEPFPELRRKAEEDPKSMTDDEWRMLLSPDQYEVMREHGTEAPFSGPLNKLRDKGKYLCAGCNTELFSSETKFDAGCGWPSFYDTAKKDGQADNLERREDTSLNMVRTEVLCKRCGSHLGHVFDDGPPDKTGLRYCINSVCMKFKK